MNKLILAIAVAILAMAMLATPVLAIGPQNAVKNPNIAFPPYGVGLDSPSGIHQEWVTSENKHLMWADARDLKINNAFVVTDVSQIADNENKWVYFTADKWGDWLAFVYDAAPSSLQWISLHRYALLNNPEGVYYREVLVGK